MASIIAPVMRKGRAKPDMTFLRQFPGKRRFERVSEDDWNVPLPHKDIAGFGHILRLEADVRVFSPRGGLVIARKWPSRSYIRNFARILRNLFGQNVQLVDRAAGNQTVALNNGVSVATGLIPSITFETAGTGSLANPEDSGVAMAIGNGVPNENHQRNDLVARVSSIISSRNNIRTSVQNLATTTLEVTTGITNGQAVTLNITEMGMFLFAIPNSVNQSTVPFSTLLAYDGFAATPVASGGVIAPRYTMDFPV